VVLFAKKCRKLASFTGAPSGRVPILSHCTKHFVAGFTDEAGGHANAQLFCLAEADLSLLPAPDPPLRTLTLGVLIVAAGTLAALPFRRYQAIPDASSAPAQVTGPMQSALEPPLPATEARKDESNSVTVLFAASGDTQPPSQTQTAQTYTAQTYPVPTYHSDNLQRRNWLGRSRRRAEIPLTYEDLQVPIDQPEPIKERFNATVPIRALRLEQERTAELVMPAMESLATSQLEQIEKAAAEFAQGTGYQGTKNLGTGKPGIITPPAVTGSLASSRDRTLDQLPKSESSDRTRHWIRQPD